MSHDLNYLTDETKAVLTDNVKVLAREWNKTERFINMILSEERGDPFSDFLPLYDAAVRGGLPVCYWLNRLESSRLRYAPIMGLKDPIECLEEKIDKSSELIKEFSRSLSDGKLDLSEIRRLEPKVESCEKALELIRTMLNFQKGVMENGGSRNGRKIGASR